jgi:hypothetical protein
MGILPVNRLKAVNCSQQRRGMGILPVNRLKAVTLSNIPYLNIH